MTVPTRIRKNTPIVPVDATDLVPGATIVANDGRLFTVKTARKRNGKVNITLDGHKGMLVLERWHPVNVFSA